MTRKRRRRRRKTRKTQGRRKRRQPNRKKQGRDLVISSLMVLGYICFCVTHLCVVNAKLT